MVASWLAKRLLSWDSSLFCCRNDSGLFILYRLAADKEDIMSIFFTYEERLTLQKELKEGHSMKAIARILGKNPTTVSREIKKYSSEVIK